MTDAIEARVKVARILACDTYEESTRKEYELGKLMHRLVDDIEALLRVVRAGKQGSRVPEGQSGVEDIPARRNDSAVGWTQMKCTASKEGGETR